MGVIPSCTSKGNPAKYGPRNLYEVCLEFKHCRPLELTEIQFTKEMRARVKKAHVTGEKVGIGAN